MLIASSVGYTQVGNQYVNFCNINANNQNYSTCG